MVVRSTSWLLRFGAAWVPALLGLTAFATAGCASVATDPTVDAGSDAGAQADAGRPRDRTDGGDAGDAAEQDGGDDAGAPDAGRPDPDWAPVIGLPSWCVVEWSRAPADIWTPRVEPCPEEAPCRRIDPVTTYDGLTFQAGTGGHDGERGYFVVGLDFVFDHLRPLALAADTSGKIYGAWRNARLSDPGSCGVNRTSYSEDGQFFAWEIVVKPEGGGGEHSFLYHAPTDELVGPHEPVAVLGPEDLPGISGVEELAISETTLVAVVSPASRLYAVSIPTGELHILTDFEASSGQPVSPRVQGDTVYWEEWFFSGAAIMRSVDYGPSEVFWFEEGIHNAAFDVRNGRMTWIRAWDRQPGGGFAHNELRTARVDVWPLSPRSLGAVGGLTNLERAGPNHYVFAWDSIEVVDLDTGVRREWNVPRGTRVRGEPMYVTETEVMMNMSLHDGDRGGAKIIRFSDLPLADD